MTQLPTETVDESLRAYATDRQWSCYVAYCEAGSYRKAAALLGETDESNIRKAVKKLQEKALQAGHVPDGYVIGSFTTQTSKDGEKRYAQKVVRDGGDRQDFPYVPDPKAVKFTTTNLDSNLRVKSQWVREERELKEKAELWANYAEELVRPIELAVFPELTPIVTPAPEDLCALYPIGDYHVGMMAWGLETRGENYDLKISEQLLATAAAHLMKGAPPSKQCVLAFMGDFLHFDSFRPETPAHKHLLDADSRFGKVGRVAIRIIRHLIAAARRYHENVHVIFLGGNHDPAVAELINVFLGEFYADVPNVTVDLSPSCIRYLKWGNNLLGFHHGDKTKPAKLPMVMANDMRKEWGECEHCYVFTGHVHHESQKKDETGTFVETVPVLIPNDAHSSSHGYRSINKMQVIILDRQFGEDQRHTFHADRFFKSRETAL